MKVQSSRIKTLKKSFGLLGKKKVLLYWLLFFKSLDLLIGIAQPFFYYLFINHVIVKGKIRHLPIVIAGYLSVFFDTDITDQVYQNIVHDFICEAEDRIAGSCLEKIRQYESGFLYKIYYG